MITMHELPCIQLQIHHLVQGGNNRRLDARVGFLILFFPPPHRSPQLHTCIDDANQNVFSFQAQFLVNTIDLCHLM